MEFIGRERELAKIKKELGASDQRNVLVYGRRRVGKSELIKQAIAGIPGSTAIYYECRQTSEEDNLASLSSLTAEALGFPPAGLLKHSRTSRVPVFPSEEQAHRLRS